MISLDNKKIWHNPVYFIGFGFGTGLISIAPGTWGTLAALPLFFILIKIPLVYYWLVTGGLLLLGIYCAQRITKELGQEDFKGIVIDEIVGFLITMGFVAPSLLTVICGFIFFRVFDIVKPYPISWIDRNITGGLGVMLDDVCAAIPAGFLLFIISKFLV